MKYLLSIISILFIYNTTQGQSFEGKLTYSVEFNMNEEILGKMGMTKEDVIDKMKREKEYFDEITIYLQRGNYIKEDNSEKRKKLVYKADENLIYIFEKNSDYVILLNAEKLNSFNLKPKQPVLITEPDTLKVIQGDTCNLLRLSWGNISEQDYWYSQENLKINSKLFEKHNYEHLNTVLTYTNSYPMAISTSIGVAMTIKMTIKSIEEMEIDENLFIIPELKKSKRKSDKLIQEMSGNQMMKIKN